MNRIVLVAGALLALLTAGCAAPTDSSDIAAAESRAASMATREGASPTPSLDAATPAPTKKAKRSQSASPTADSPEDSGGTRDAAQWTDFPWGSNGQECPEPARSPGATTPPLDERVVVILGDSLIRDARDEISAQLQSAGFRPVFVCWGGKNLDWGATQTAIMRSKNLLPRCLVINLGTNDLKGTTAQGLTDAVGLTTVKERLVNLLSSVADIDHVFTVDIAAETTAAPSTLAEVGQAPALWEDAVATAGVGQVIPWSQSATAGSGLTNTTPGDGVHDTIEGIQTRARLITEAVTSTCG